MRKRVSRDDTIQATVSVVGETEKAVKLMFCPGHRRMESEHWVPKSLITNPDDIDVMAKTCDLEIKAWFIEKEGIIYE